MLENWHQGERKPINIREFIAVSSMKQIHLKVQYCVIHIFSHFFFFSDSLSFKMQTDFSYLGLCSIVGLPRLETAVHLADIVRVVT